MSFFDTKMCVLPNKIVLPTRRAHVNVFALKSVLPTCSSFYSIAGQKSRTVSYRLKKDTNGVKSSFMNYNIARGRTLFYRS